MVCRISKLITALGIAFVLSLSSALAEMRANDGVISAQKLPKPHVSKASTYLDVPHIRQGLNLCVPTSSAMVLAYFGDSRDPRALKALAEGHKPKAKQNRDFTYWSDMAVALRQVGYSWQIKGYARTDAGFKQGLNEIKRSLRKGRPVLIEVHLGVGHTFVVTGFDESQQVVFIRDPDLPKSRARKLSYAQLNRDWHNHRFGQNRSAFFSRP